MQDREPVDGNWKQDLPSLSEGHDYELVSYRWNAAPNLALPEEAGFSAAEHWAWEQIALGRRADMQNAPNGDNCLTALFLETVLFTRPWAHYRARPLARIVNAVIREPVDFEARPFVGKLEFIGCHFTDEVAWQGLKIERSLLLQDCRFDKAFTADRMRIGGTLAIEGTVFTGPVKMDDIAVATDISIRKSVFGDLWSIDDARIEGSIFFGPGGDFKGRVEARRIKVGKSLDLSRAAFEREIALVGSQIGGELLLDAKMMVKRGFMTGKPEPVPPSHVEKDAPEWGDRAKLNLRNVTTYILQSSISAWKQPDGRFVARDLTGLTFSRLGGGENRVDSLHRESKFALVDWLEKDLLRTERALPNNGYSPARYRSLARTLRETGHENKARYVLWAMGRARKRSLPLFSTSKVIDTLSGQITGYGYQQVRGVLWALALVSVFAVLGMVWPSETRMGRDILSLADWVDWFGFSVEKAAPLSDLDPIQDEFLMEKFGGTEHIPTYMRAAFMLERVLGLVILGFVIAGFTGWAERRGE